MNMHALSGSLTVEHSNRIEAIQKRAFRIIFGSFDYLDFWSRNGLSTLYERRDLLARQFFQSILNFGLRGFLWVPPQNDMYHNANLHADRFHHRRDICPRAKKRNLLQT